MFLKKNARKQKKIQTAQSQQLVHVQWRRQTPALRLRRQSLRAPSDRDLGNSNAQLVLHQNNIGISIVIIVLIKERRQRAQKASALSPGYFRNITPKRSYANFDMTLSFVYSPSTHKRLGVTKRPRKNIQSRGKPYDVAQEPEIFWVSNCWEMDLSKICRHHGRKRARASCC